LHLVRVADRVLLIGVHASGCTLLESLPRQGFEERPLG
jgi:flagellar biogenesis protein FliO